MAARLRGYAPWMVVVTICQKTVFCYIYGINGSRLTFVWQLLTGKFDVRRHGTTNKTKVLPIYPGSSVFVRVLF